MAQRQCPISIVFACAAIFITAANAAELSRVDSKDGKTRLDLSGEIQPGDLDKLQTIIRAANDAKRVVATIRFDSIGGNLLEGVRMAEVIRYGKISTAVLSGKTCASACFIMFAAGSEKYAHYTARIGVHGASDRDGEETPQSNAATVTMGRVVKDFGVPAGIVGKLVVTPPSEMVWLGLDDLRSMNVTMLGKPIQVPDQAAPQSQLPTPIQPNARATVPQDSPKLAWSDFVKESIQVSAAQNGGHANFGRTCQPQLKVCTMAVFVKNKGAELMIRTTEDVNGKIIQRDICSFNDFKDVRTCVDWDTKAVQRSMKNSKGEWEAVSE